MVGKEKKLVKKPRQSQFVAGLSKRQDAVDSLTTRAVNQTRQMSKKAEATAKANITKTNQKQKAFRAKYGSAYDYRQVMKVQKQLKDAGFYKGNIDGDWGKGTQAAWEAYSAQEQSKPKDVYSAARGNTQFGGALLQTALNDGNNIIHKHILVPIANKISPTYGVPALAYLRGVIDSNNPFNKAIGGANWGDSMLTPEATALWKSDVRAGRSDSYKGTKNEGGSSDDAARFVLSNVIGGYTPTEYGATDNYDWKNYGTLDDTNAKAARHLTRGLSTGNAHEIGTAVKNYMEFAAPYLMMSETGESKAAHANGTRVEGFTPEQVERINGWWQSAPHSELHIKK